MSNINSTSPESCLPVELLEGILSHLQTKELLRISTVSQRVYASVDYLVRQRFRNLEDLYGHHLIFECSPPSRRVRIPLTPFIVERLFDIFSREQNITRAIIVVLTPLLRAHQRLLEVSKNTKIPPFPAPFTLTLSPSPLALVATRRSATPPPLTATQGLSLGHSSSALLPTLHSSWPPLS